MTDITTQKWAAAEALKRSDAAEQLSASLKTNQHMAEFATVGVYDVDINGRLTHGKSALFLHHGMHDSILNLLRMLKNDLNHC